MNYGYDQSQLCLMIDKGLCPNLRLLELSSQNFDKFEKFLLRLLSSN